MKHRGLGVAVGALGVAAILVSVLAGTSGRLPGVALGSVVLLYAERAVALLGIAIAAVSVLAQAARGRLPVELSTSGVRYEADAADDAAAAAADLQDQFSDLEETVDALADQLDALTRRP
jgi:hypothetical protein